jgi:FixJ family two-component response regulator
VIDDDESVRKSLLRLLKSADYMAKAFESATAWLDRDDASEPSCVILDVRMPGLDGPTLHTRLVKESGVPVSVVFLSGHGTVPMAARELKRGAIDFLTKPVDESDLLTAVDEAILAYEANTSEYAQTEEAQSRMDSLTPRELEVVRYVISGLRNKQIAIKMGIAEKTVKVHRGHIVEKLGVSSVVELVYLCRIAQITPHDLHEPL